MIVENSPGGAGTRDIAHPDSRRNHLHLAIVFVTTFIAVYGIETGALVLIVGGGR